MDVETICVSAGSQTKIHFGEEEKNGVETNPRKQMIAFVKPKHNKQRNI